MDQDGNSPKERARILMDKIQALKPTTLDEAKSFGLLLCKEIINYEFFGSTTQRYWMKVKEQIEKCQ